MRTGRLRMMNSLQFAANSTDERVLAYLKIHANGKGQAGVYDHIAVELGITTRELYESVNRLDRCGLIEYMGYSWGRSDILEAIRTGVWLDGVAEIRDFETDCGVEGQPHGTGYPHRPK